MKKDDRPYVTLAEVMAEFTPEQRVRIKKRSAELIAEEKSLRELRKAQKKSQTAIAKKLKVKQAAVSKMESSTDMYLNTIRKYIEAMGGRLDLIAYFPGNKMVRINQFHDL